jgi:endonuclease/exonuclease/phosphatase family metal-dependent hydrolase
MSFNVRYPNPSDGPDTWDRRRDLLVETIRQADPDLIGTQELFFEQGQYIVEQLPQYAWFGLSRRGNREDEHMGVFYRRDRWELVEPGNFWLSETPDKPNSLSWGINLPRMATWGRFRAKRDGRMLYFFNTHFPHRRDIDAAARVECARVLATRLGQVPSGATLIVTGDFNTDAGTEPYNVLTKILTDAQAGVREPAGPVGTFHGFKGVPDAARIDWVLYRGALKPISYETITRNQDGRYPSDHFPVLAGFSWADSK